MATITGLSGNEIYCLNQKGFKPGDIVVGNSVYSLGLLRGISTGVKSIFGGELQHVTELIEEGRETAYRRMLKEAEMKNATGITGVSSDIIFHSGNIEFLSIGSMVFADDKTDKSQFSTSANGQELYAQLDAGYKPMCFSFGNVAYSMGVGRGILGGLKTFVRGEVKEYSDMFNHTRHLALERIAKHAKSHGANAVCGIQTTIIPFVGTNEMLMLGTASYNPQLNFISNTDIVTSDLTNIEMWNLSKLGFAPMKLLLGTSVFSLGIIGGITSVIKSFVRGEINELTTMIYDARENALKLINDEAKAIGADDVVGVRTYVNQLGNGLIEFLAIGTAVKKTDNLKTQSDQIIPQAIIRDQDTFYSRAFNTVSANLNDATPLAARGLAVGIFIITFFFILMIHYFLR